LRSRYEDSHIEDALLLKKVVLGQEITKAAAIFKAEREKGGCTSLRDLALKGEDLEMLGFAKGPDIGRALDFLFDRVIEDPEKNNKETLLSLAKGLLKY
jgi:tRNA nucleotidyltransferase (CCA-adding enzyme)